MLLADACAILAFFGRSDVSMTGAGIAAMRTDVAVCSITVYELTLNAAMGRLPPLPRVGGSFAGYLRQRGFRDHPLSWDDTKAANAFPSLHKDPMDRMLIASALRSDLAVITHDRMFSAYGVRTVW